MSHAGHEIVKCSCGTLIMQCRCAFSAKPTRIVEDGCERCQRIIKAPPPMPAMTPAEIQAEYLRRAGAALLEALKDMVAAQVEMPENMDMVEHNAKAAIRAATPPTCTACGKMCLDPSDGRCASCALRLDASLQDGAEGWRDRCLCGGRGCNSCEPQGRW